MPQRMDLAELFQRAEPALGRGPVSAQELATSLGVSRPTVARMLARHREHILRLGTTRGARYWSRRSVLDVGFAAPIFEVDERGSSHRVGTLNAAGGEGFYVESVSDFVDTCAYDDWPWFLHGMRPAGFLGRRIAELHPELQLPADTRSWTGDQTLRYLATHGFNAVGSLIVGERALQRWLESTLSPAAEDEDPTTLYPRLADSVLAGAPPGSSAAGEQPKFLVRQSASRPERLVKFSPVVDGRSTRRAADLLIAEHHALRSIACAGRRAANTRIIHGANRVFLESERFDRTVEGRRGLLSLEALDLEWVGLGGHGNWIPICRRLDDLDLLAPAHLDEVTWLSAFGQLIANTDMHPGNLSFISRGSRILEVAPAYDMVPMLYAPVAGNTPNKVFSPSAPPLEHMPHWGDAAAAALDCWKRIANDDLVSAEFRGIASANAAKVERARTMVQRLPS